MAQEIKSGTLAAQETALPKKITYEEYLTLPEEFAHTEWVNGEVVWMSPVSREHQGLGGFLLSLIQFLAETHRLGVVLYEPFQMKTGPDLPGRSPDILFVAKKHLSRLKTNYLEGPADLVVEIISPESRARDRGEKFYEYEAGGVPEYWLIDQPRKQADFYRLGKDGIYRPIPVGDDGIFRSVVLKGFWLKVDWLWQKPLPTLMSVLKQWKLV